KEYETKDEVSYAVKESEEAGVKIAEHANILGIKNVHFCTATLKDKHQLGKRIKRRAKNAKLNSDKLTKEGMLIRGAIYEKDYNNKKAVSSDIEKFSKLRDELIELGIKPKNLHVDNDFARLLTSEKIAKKYADVIKEKKFKVFVVEEYPTKDAFPIEIEEL
ncbi:hypothetical protein BVX95_01730, partial [archaeon D22]